ncbi:hypothetical protein TNCV_3397091 [Trichonephila clavipes]|nr:hypothetical protein TNCV_3397091 [Trichonephila clavipes]
MEEESASPDVSFHHIPHIFYGVKIRAMWWPGTVFSEPILNTFDMITPVHLSMPAEHAPYHDISRDPCTVRVRQDGFMDLSGSHQIRRFPSEQNKMVV